MEFQKFCEASGIQRHLTAPYTPQQNEVVERRNRTLLEMTRSILKHIEFAFTHKNQRKRCSLEVLDKKLAIAQSHSSRLDRACAMVMLNLMWGSFGSVVPLCIGICMFPRLLTWCLLILLVDGVFCISFST